MLESMRILVVDDDPGICDSLDRALRREEYTVSIARDGEEALASVDAQCPDAIILDVSMPKLDGLSVCRRLRAAGSRVPILVLTARHSLGDRVAGLDAGADDYLAKPFDPDELVARVRALLRRSAAHGRVPRLCVGDVVLDPVSREVFRGKRRLVLTQREFSLLEYFMRNAGRELTRQAIAQQVWRQTPVDIDETNIVDVYVAYLRRKLDTQRDAPMLHTVRGIGYVLRP